MRCSKPQRLDCTLTQAQSPPLLSSDLEPSTGSNTLRSASRICWSGIPPPAARIIHSEHILRRGSRRNEKCFARVYHVGITQYVCISQCLPGQTVLVAY